MKIYFRYNFGICEIPKYCHLDRSPPAGGRSGERYIIKDLLIDTNTFLDTI